MRLLVPLFLLAAFGLGSCTTLSNRRDLFAPAKPAGPYTTLLKENRESRGFFEHIRVRRHYEQHGYQPGILREEQRIEVSSLRSQPAVREYELPPLSDSAPEPQRPVPVELFEPPSAPITPAEGVPELPETPAGVEPPLPEEP